MKRVLITGASGFIGVHCLAPLRERGYEIHAATLGRPTAPVEGVTWHEADLLRPGAGRALLERVAPSHLLHLAWYVVPGKVISSPENLDWVTASLELVRAFVDGGGQRLVVSGSSYEYDWSHGYCTEGLTPCVPDTVYGACKLGLHEMLRTYAAARQVSFAWPRIFFLYGPNEHPQRLVSSVARALLRGEPAPCSHGRQIRDYMHVQDVADGLVAVMDSGHQGAVNVCSGQALTIREIVTTMGRLVGRPELVQLGAIPARANDAPLVVGANARALALGWAPRIDLEAGLQQTIDWWRRQG